MAKNKASTSSATHTTPSFLTRFIEAVFHFLLICTPLFFLSVNEELFEFNKMLLVYAGTILIVTAWGIRMAWEKRLIWQRSPFDIPIALFLISQLLSTFLSIHPRTSWMGYYTRFHGGLWSTLAYLTLFYAYIANIRQPRQHRRFLWSLLLGGLLAAVYAIPEHFGHSVSCQLIAGQFTVDCWIQDVRTRIFGTFGQPNWLAAYAITLIPLLSGWLLTRSRTTQLLLHSPARVTRSQRAFVWQQVFIVVTIMALFLTVLFTRSRSGFLGLAIGMSIFALLGTWVMIRKQTLRQHVFSRKKLLLLLPGLMVLAVAWFGTPFNPALSEWNTQTRIENTTPGTPAVVENRLETGGTASGEIRKIVWEGSLNIWKKYPLFGTGLETFAYSYYNFRPLEHNLVSEWDFLYNKAHNELLNILANSGLVGLLSYGLLQISIFWWLLRSLWKAQDEQENGLQLGLIASLIALHISNFFGFSTVVVSLLMYLLPAYLYRRSLTLAASEEKSVATTQTKPTPNTGQIFGIVGIGIVGAYALIQVYMTWFADKLYADTKLALQSGDIATAAATINQAIQLSPSEAIFYELKSKVMSQAALSLAQQNQLEDANLYANEAFDASDTSLRLNPMHLNLYRSRVQVLLTLAQVEPSLYAEAKKTAEVALKLAPTDAKLVYTIGIIESYLQEYDQAIVTLEKAVAMKSNYEAARFALGQLYEEKARYQEASAQYQYIIDHIAPNNEQAREKIAELATRSAEKK